MDYSPAGLIGAMLGCVVGATQFVLFVGLIEHRLRASEAANPQSDREEFERKLSVMRRTILALDIAAFSAGGYLLGKTLAG
jgi:hypothetical protein